MYTNVLGGFKKHKPDIFILLITYSGPYYKHAKKQGNFSIVLQVTQRNVLLLYDL